MLIDHSSDASSSTKFVYRYQSDRIYLRADTLVYLL
jgi:hypothetical protein